MHQLAILFAIISIVSAGVAIYYARRAIVCASQAIALTKRARG